MKNKRSGLLKLLFIIVCLNAFGQTNWKKFNHKNGFTIQLPSYFNEGLLVAGGTLQFYNNTLDSQIFLSVETWGKTTPADLKMFYEGDLKTYLGITYKVYTNNWYVISGQNEEGIFYNKSIINNGFQHHLRITYPIEQKTLFDNIIGKISSSFK